MRRHGFTLVEMLVAMALVMFVMVLMTQAFVAGVGTFRDLKAIGDMEERLRAVTTVMKRDLAADHWEGRRMLSDPNFFVQGPPREGFFRIWQGSLTTPIGPSGTPVAINGIADGWDSDGILLVRAVDHALHFTVKLHGNGPQDFLLADISGDPSSPLASYGLPSGQGPDSRYQVAGMYTCQWAEVAYFLVATGDNALGTPLYALYRRQRLAVPDNSNPTLNLNWASPPTSPPLVPIGLLSAYADVSCMPNPNAGYPTWLYFNNPTDLTVPDRRFGGVLSNYNPIGNAAELLVTDVISFQVQIYNPAVGDFSDVPASTTNPRFGIVPPTGAPWSGPFVYDTWSMVKDDTYDYSAWNDTNPASPLAVQQTRIPLQNAIPAIKVTLRVWDKNSQKTRQVTFVQAM